MIEDQPHELARRSAIRRRIHQPEKTNARRRSRTGRRAGPDAEMGQIDVNNTA